MPPDTMEANSAVCLRPPATPRLAKMRRGARQVCWLDRWSDVHNTASQVLEKILGKLQHYIQGPRHSTRFVTFSIAPASEGTSTKQRSGKIDCNLKKQEIYSVPSNTCQTRRRDSACAYGGRVSQRENVGDRTMWTHSSMPVLLRKVVCRAQPSNTKVQKGRTEMDRWHLTGTEHTWSIGQHSVIHLFYSGFHGNIVVVSLSIFQVVFIFRKVSA